MVLEDITVKAELRLLAVPPVLEFPEVLPVKPETSMEPEKVVMVETLLVQVLQCLELEVEAAITAAAVVVQEVPTMVVPEVVVRTSLVLEYQVPPIPRAIAIGSHSGTA
jgi:hypothetical protein